MANDPNSPKITNSNPEPEPFWKPSRSFWLSMLNLILAVVIGWMLFHDLGFLRKHRSFGDEIVTTTRDTVFLNDSTIEIRKIKIIESRATTDTLLLKRTTSVAADTGAGEKQPESSPQKGKVEPSETDKTKNVADKTKNAAEKTKTDKTLHTASVPESEKRFLDFFDILVLMLIAGALGGILCNLRGIFVYYRDEGELPRDLHVPYLVRPFTGAICGVFIYFVASFVITSVTLTPMVEGIGFQGLVTYVGFAILSGFGSQEFMERLKAVVVTFFGERANEVMVQRLRQVYHLREKGVINDAEFEKLKDQVISENLSGSAAEVLKILRSIHPKGGGVIPPSGDTTTTPASTPPDSTIENPAHA